MEYKIKKEKERLEKLEKERLRKLEEEKKRKEDELKKIKDNEVNLEDLREPKLRALEEEDENLIERVFGLQHNKIVGTHQGSNIEVRVKDLCTLEDGQWLNDEVMNFYMALLQDRNIKRTKENPKHVRVLLMNTFFYTKLS